MDSIEFSRGHLSPCTMLRRRAVPERLQDWTILTGSSLSVCLDLASEAVKVYIPDGRHSINDGTMRITGAMIDDTQALASGTANHSY